MNKVCLYGRVSTEPHFGTVEKNDMHYCTIMLEVDRGLSVKGTVMVPIIMFGDMAETAARTIRYNQHIGIEGRLGTSSFAGKNRLSVIATRIDLADIQSTIADEMIEHIKKYRRYRK